MACIRLAWLAHPHPLSPVLLSARTAPSVVSSQVHWQCIGKLSFRVELKTAKLLEARVRSHPTCACGPHAHAMQRIRISCGGKRSL
eukprot:scaffold270_cov121-Isochrysis_galbana.AAC.17